MEQALELDGYRIDQEIGRGAMGRVLSATQLQLDRPVAVKVLPSGFAADPDVRGRFAAEARVLAGLDHPHVVPVYDFVDRNGVCALVMQRLDGGTLLDRLTTTGVSRATACASILGACAGLAHAHAHRVLHRDVKPANLMFDEVGRLKVTDFGLAAVLGGDDTLMTTAGQVLGTPAYMAPEQGMGGEAIGPQVDVYAVATMLYELLCGRLPFDEGDDPLDLLRRHAEEAPTPLGQVAPSVPEGIAQVVMAGLSTHPGDRPEGVEGFGVELARAATLSWGGDWIAMTDVQLLAGGAIAAAVTTTVLPGVGSPLPPDVEPTRVVIRAEADRDGQRSIAASIGPGDVVKVRHAVGRRRPWWLPATAAVILGAAALAVALSGEAAPESSGLVTAEVGGPEVLVAGVAPGEGIATVDLSDPIDIQIADGSTGTGTAQLEFRATGIPVGSSSVGQLKPNGGGSSTQVMASTQRIVTTGVMTAQVLVGVGGAPPAPVATIELRNDRPVWATAAGWIGALAAMLAAANGVGFGRWLRRGRRPLRGGVGLGAAGAVGGAVAAWWGWLLGGPTISWATLPAPALLGAAAGGSAALAVWWAGQNRRRRTRARRA